MKVFRAVGESMELLPCPLWKKRSLTAEGLLEKRHSAPGSPFYTPLVFHGMLWKSRGSSCAVKGCFDRFRPSSCCRLVTSSGERDLWPYLCYSGHVVLCILSSWRALVPPKQHPGATGVSSSCPASSQLDKEESAWGIHPVSESFRVKIRLSASHHCSCNIKPSLFSWKGPLACGATPSLKTAASLWWSS